MRLSNNFTMGWWKSEVSNYDISVFIQRDHIRVKFNVLSVCKSYSLNKCHKYKILNYGIKMVHTFS